VRVVGAAVRACGAAALIVLAPAGCRPRTAERAPSPALAPAQTPALAEAPASIAAPAGAAETAAAIETAADGGAAPAGDEALVGEERERDPRSETVTVKVIVDERRKAHVLWGPKDLGGAPLEIVRPRNSGPLDLVVTAPGYLPLHARAFTDRDDKLVLRLYSEAEAPQLLGFRPEQETLQNRPQNGSAARAQSPREKK